MKRFLLGCLTIIISLSICTGFSFNVKAQGTEEPIVTVRQINDNATVKWEVYNSNTLNEYTVITSQVGDSVTVIDSRESVARDDNGDIIGTFKDEEQSIMPFSYYHGSLAIADHWSLIIKDPLKEINWNVSSAAHTTVVSLITAAVSYYTGPLGGFAFSVIEGLANKNANSGVVYIQRVTFGNHYQISDFAYLTDGFNADRSYYGVISYDNRLTY